MSAVDYGNPERPWFKDSPCPECGRPLTFSEEDREWLDNATAVYGTVYCECGYEEAASYDAGGPDDPGFRFQR